MSYVDNSPAYRIQHLLGEANYSTWSVKMVDILTDVGLIDYALGKNPCPTHTFNASGAIVDPQGTKAAAITAWQEKDRKALSQIRLRVADDPLVYITNTETSSAAWSTLADTYQPKGVIAVVLLRRQLFRLHCEEGASIEEHIRSLTNLRTKLAAQNSKLTDAEFSITLLTSLPDSWDTFISGIDTASLTESSKLIARILEQDRRRTAKPNSDEVALTARHHNNMPHDASARRTKFNPDITCYGCGRIGHIKADCHDTKRGITFSDEEKERNGRTSRERHHQNSQAHVAQWQSQPTIDYAFISVDTPAVIPTGSTSEPRPVLSPPQLKGEQNSLPSPLIPELEAPTFIPPLSGNPHAHPDAHHPPSTPRSHANVIVYDADPLSVEQAQSRHHWSQWQSAINAELSRAISSGAIPASTSSQLPPPFSWIFRTRRDAHGTILRYKACIIRQGFSQDPHSTPRHNSANNPHVPAIVPGGVFTSRTPSAHRSHPKYANIDHRSTREKPSSREHSVPLPSYTF